MKRTTIACCLASTLLSSAPSPAQQQPATAADAQFAQPYIDTDEWRSTPVRHRYVHGGFKGTQTRFSFYFPEKAGYQGRFFQHITPVPDSETLAQAMPAGEENKIGFAIASGAYFVETNGGGAAMLPPAAPAALTAYQANAATARYSRVVALAMYGGKRPYGYAYGGSGGGFRTVGAAENSDAWDGVVPYVLGSPMAPPNMFSVRMRAMRVLNDAFPRILDAVEPGGSGDPYGGLTSQQASVLREVTKMGFPTPSWFGWRTMGIHGFAALYGGMQAADAGYFDDFWTKPGYLGHDDPQSFAGYRLQYDTRVTRPITALEAARLKLDTSIVNGAKNGGVDNAFARLQGAEAQRVVAFRLAAAPPKTYFAGGDLVVGSGAAKGQRLTISRIAGDVVVLGIADAAVAARIAPGDAVRVDNSNFLAAETYHWHQVPPADAGYPVWDQFRGADDKPLYPQRPFLLGPLFTAATTGKPIGQPPMTGVFKGKMILVENLWDREAMPWQGDWYAQRVRANLGAATDASFRLWYVDHALHGDSATQEDPTRTVSYLGVLQQALRDLSAWVEQGIAPPSSTAYRIDDGQVIVPGTAAARRGIQPVVSVTANGAVKAVIKRGQTVRFAGTIETPPGTGRIVAAAWNFDGKGSSVTPSAVPTPQARLTVSATHAFARPGTYYPSLLVASERNGDRRSPYARIQNLGRVRVVVQ
ncbi:tannase/feruloyl esterase family alpha/beta hydrolase [Sphingomonas ginsenosidivorax]|uniref:Tannase/feruloyl esterase family alpha/beta hydrolase n=1 Tax=Sphingomonas ginsenosidivorax TaxID=862135 RepID=A0A5C6UDR7_9SPHN|nr:PKD domain-containing protein [Sphingomonas ginsenosidivorax]TXC70276.1 tannase/feruloyl esterase family alpha/beta hydrolase [Sphingomonas ginsenosidivorax]